jgi:DNA-binding NtrC family response regulator
MKKKKALVIDDEQIVLDSVRRVLTEENFDVDITLSSRTGLTLALDNVYDIVLTDIRMPESDGMTVLLDVKAAKPFTPDQLIDRVTAAIDTAANIGDGEQRTGRRQGVSG